MAEIQIQGTFELANISTIPNTTVPTQASNGEKRSPRERLWEVVLVWWVLVAHLILCIAIALCMTLLLDNYKALNNAAGKP